MSKLSAWIVEHAAASRLTMRVSHLKGHTVGAVPSTPQVAAEESACILRLLFPLENALAYSLQCSQQVVETHQHPGVNHAREPALQPVLRDCRKDDGRAATRAAKDGRRHHGNVHAAHGCSSIALTCTPRRLPASRSLDQELSLWPLPLPVMLAW